MCSDIEDRRASHAARLTFLFLAMLLAGCQPNVSPTAADENASAAHMPTHRVPASAAPGAGHDASAKVDVGRLHVTVFGDRLLIEDSGHGWPVTLDKSTKAFVLRGMAHFGTPRASDGPDDCPAGKLEFLDYSNGLQLAFQDDRLVGYWVREGAQGIATERGVQPGSPRSALGDASIIEASFGFLADLDGVIAILDERKTRVTDLYAGAACIYD